MGSRRHGDRPHLLHDRADRHHREDLRATGAAEAHEGLQLDVRVHRGEAAAFVHQGRYTVPSPNRVMSESAIANANIGPSTRGPCVISFSAPTRAPTRASPAIASSSVGGTRTARSAAVLANSAISRPAATGRYTDRYRRDCSPAPGPAVSSTGGSARETAMGPMSEPTIVPMPPTTLRTRSGGWNPWLRM